MSAKSLRDQVKDSVLAVLTPFPKGITVRRFTEEYVELQGSHLPFKDLGFDSVFDLLASFKDIVKITALPNGEKLLQVIPNEKIAHIYKLVKGQNKRTNKQANSIPKLSSSSGKAALHVHSQHDLPKDFEQNVLNLLDNWPDGIPLDRLSCEYCSKYGKSLPLNFAQLATLMSSMKRFRIESRQGKYNTTNLFVVKPATGSTSASLAQAGIPDEIKVNVQKVVEKYPCGTYTDDFPYIYSSINREALDFTLMGFRSPLEFLSTLDGKFIKLNKTETTALKIYPIMNVLTVQPEQTVSVPCQGSSMMEIDFSQQTKALSLEGSIPVQSLAAPLEADIFPVTVTAVTNPGYFYWILQVCQKPVIELEEDMTKFYNSSTGSSFAMKSNEIYLEHFVAAKNSSSNQWQRAIVTSFKMNSEYLVRFVDSGRLQKTHLSQIRHLLVQYAALPMQAKKSQLHGVKPAGPDWSREATLELQSLLQVGPITARCLAVEEDEESCHVVELFHKGMSLAARLAAKNLVVLEHPKTVREAVVEHIKAIDLPDGYSVTIIRLGKDLCMPSHQVAKLSARFSSLDHMKQQLASKYEENSRIFLLRKHPRLFDELRKTGQVTGEEVEVVSLEFALNIFLMQGTNCLAIFDVIQEELAQPAT